MADRKCIVVESPAGQMARQRQGAVFKRCRRSQTRLADSPVTEAYFPKVEKGGTRGMEEGSGNLEGDKSGVEWSGVERERTRKTDSVRVRSQEEEELAEKEKESAERERSRKSPAKSKAKTVTTKEKQPSASSDKNLAIKKFKKLPTPPSNIPFQGLFSPHKARAIGAATGCVDPYTLFALLFSHEQVSLLTKHTNMYATSHRAGLASLHHPFIHKWYAKCSSELLVYYTILIYLCLSKAASPKLFWWRINGNLTEPMMHMSYTRFQQLKRYFHISEPSESPFEQKEWWKKLEPLNSSIRDQAKKCFLPSTNVAIDEMMIRFLGRSAHTIKMPNKPICLGYKVLAVCDAGYTYD